jgi:hypothetical protein
VHPTQADLVAAATSAGLFLSRDAGDEFKQVMAGAHATAAHFALEYDLLWFSALDGKPSMFLVATGATRAKRPRCRRSSATRWRTSRKTRRAGPSSQL